MSFHIERQPDGTTCGPTCLQAVYAHYGDVRPLAQVIAEVQELEGGGTLDVMLAIHALEGGYDATIYSYNLQLFDPTWFGPGSVDLAAKLRKQAEAKGAAKLRVATDAYLRFLELGGELQMEDPSPGLLRRYLKRDVPVITGLSASFLYRSVRETAEHKEDDVRGYPVGHFVVLSGYSKERREVQVADPLYPNPPFERHTYEIGIERVMAAILLGALTYDANFLVIEPRGRP